MADLEMIKGIIKDTLKVDDANITEETNLTEDLGIDSLDVVELIVAIEEATGVSVEDEDMEKLHTVGDVLKYVNDHAE